MTVGPAFLLKKVIGQNMESLIVIGTSLVVGGIVMWIVDAMNAKWEVAGPGAPGSRIHTWKMEAMSLAQAIWIGACQILSAVFPVHRGRCRRSPRASWRHVARLGPGVLVLPFDSDHGRRNPLDLLKSLPARARIRSECRRLIRMVGSFCSSGLCFFMVAYASVAWFMAWVRKRGFVPFAIYRIIAGALVLALGSLCV